MVERQTCCQPSQILVSTPPQSRVREEFSTAETDIFDLVTYRNTADLFKWYNGIVRICLALNLKNPVKPNDNLYIEIQK